MKILFVCTGNTCRSPMAEALATKALADNTANAGGIEIYSRGTSVYYAEPAAQNAITVMRDDYGIDITTHVSRPITNNDILSADLILTMTAAHKNTLLTLYGAQNTGIEGKVFTLAEYAASDTGSSPDFGDAAVLDISDPFGGSTDDYRLCAAQISRLLDLCADKLQERGIGIEGN